MNPEKHFIDPVDANSIPSNKEMNEVREQYETNIVEFTNNTLNFVNTELKKLAKNKGDKAQVQSAINKFLQDTLVPLLDNNVQIDFFLDIVGTEYDHIEVSISDSTGNPKWEVSFGINLKFDHDHTIAHTSMLEDDDYKFEGFQFDPKKCASELKNLLDQNIE